MGLTSTAREDHQQSLTFNCRTTLSDSVKHATAEPVDLKELFPFAVAAFALFFVDKTLGAPHWVSLLIFSFSSYMDLHEPEPAADEDVVESIESLRGEITALRAERYAPWHARLDHS